MTVLEHPIDPAVEYFRVRIFNFFITFINFFTGLFLGWTYSYGKNSDRKESKDDYSKSAQLVDVKYFGGYGLIDDVGLKNFFWKHNEYLHPKYILENDNVTMYGLTETHAFFCVSNPAVDITNSDMFPFYILGQKLMTEKLVILPIKHFHRLAAEVGDPNDRKVACIHMTARCGSTLLSQVFNKVPNTRVIVESLVTADIQRHYIKNKWTQAETNKCVQSAIRLLCKPVHSKKIDFITIKITPFSNAHIPYIMEAFPKFKWIFNTRTLKPAMKSFVKTINSQPWFYTWSDKFFTKFWWDHMAVTRESSLWKKLTNDYRNGGSKYTYAEKLALAGASFFHDYLKNKKNYDVCVFYEDIAKDPKTTLTEVFKAIDMDLKHLELGMTALRQDSQQGVIGARGAEKILITDKEFATMDKLYAELGLPVSSKMTLEEMKKEFQL